MQLTLTLRPAKPITLPIHYKHILQGVFYSLLSEDYSSLIHDSKDCKLISFSNFNGKFAFSDDRKSITFKDIFTWTITAYSNVIINDILNVINENNYICVGNTNVKVISYKCSFLEASENKCLVKALSPITVHRTVEDKNGKSKTIYYPPGSNEFNELILKNLNTKKELLGLLPSKGLYCIPYKNVTKVVDDVKRFIVEGYFGTFVLIGEKEDINVVLSCGLGDRNTQGFGCITIDDRVYNSKGE